LVYIQYILIEIGTFVRNNCLRESSEISYKRESNNVQS